MDRFKLLTSLKKRLPSLQARRNEFGRHPDPTQYTRDERYLDQELEWMHMEDGQPRSAATSSGRLGGN